MKRTYIPVNNKFTSKKIFFDDILLMETEANNISIITAKGRVSFRGTSKEMRKWVEGKDYFYTCHSYLVVNFRMVSSIENGWVYFRNGEQRHLGKKYFFKAKAAYADYIA
ncbi:MAG: LytTR family transcriptional regulator DNA-binding domain-containing protein [Firmicutes bacterium]|nr:LytTR family transcriptional regulator DNA-binding domain-containing protein [Bacillota bacterium]